MLRHYRVGVHAHELYNMQPDHQYHQIPPIKLWPVLACSLQSKSWCWFAFQNFPSDQEDPEACICWLHGDTLWTQAGGNAGVPAIFGECFSQSHVLSFHYIWWIRKMHQAESMKLTGLMGVIQGSWATYSPAGEQRAPVCSFTWAIIDTCVQISWVTLWKRWIPSLNHKYSCAGHSAADLGALHCWLNQELQKKSQCLTELYYC